MPRAKKPKCLEKQVENTHGSEDMRHTKPSNFWSKRLQKKKGKFQEEEEERSL